MPEQVRKVIISDGDQELLFLLRNAFVSVGFQVVTVSKNGKKLWETIRNERPDAVIFTPCKRRNPLALHGAALR